MKVVIDGVEYVPKGKVSEYPRFKDHERLQVLCRDIIEAVPRHWSVEYRLNDHELVINTCGDICVYLDKLKGGECE